MAWMGKNIFRGKESSVDGPGYSEASKTSGHGGSATTSTVEDKMTSNPGLVEQGTQLLEYFMLNQLGKSLPQFPPLAHGTRSDTDNIPRGSNTEVGRTSARLSQLAHSFSQSDERRKVKELTNTIDLDLSSDDLVDILVSIMSNSRQAEDGLVVVVFFCMDIGMRLLKSGLRPYTEVLKLCYKIIHLTMGSGGYERRDELKGTEIH